jgi:elongation factor P
MSISGSSIRRGMAIIHNGELCRVVEAQHVKPGKGPAYMQSKIRNVGTGSIYEVRFRSADTVETASLETHDLQFLYSDGTHYHFMNTNTFDQVMLDENALGDGAQWMTPELIVKVEFHSGRAVGVELPKTLELRVQRTDPGAKGDTKTAYTKPALLENGVTVQVPAFVNEGELIRVDPAEGVYLERVR